MDICYVVLYRSKFWTYDSVCIKLITTELHALEKFRLKHKRFIPGIFIEKITLIFCVWKI